jgi:AAA15 family ATPase/GTPase
MIKLNRIKVSNFKNIKEADVTFGDFNVIVGPNNSGKSNFLQVLGFLNHIFLMENDNKIWSYHMGNYTGIVNFINYDNQPDNYYFFVQLEFESTYGEKVYSYKYNISIRWRNEKILDAIKLTPVIEEESFQFKEKNKTGPFKAIFKRNGIKIDSIKTPKKVHIDGTASVVPFLKIIRFYTEKEEEKKFIEKSLDDLIGITSSTIYYFSPSELKNEKNEY